MVSGMEYPWDLLPLWEGRPVYKGMTGSHAFGVNTAESDFDYFCVWVHPLDHYLGMATLPESNRHQRELIYQQSKEIPEGKVELVTIDIRHFFLQLYRNRLQFHKWLWVPSELVDRKDKHLEDVELDVYTKLVQWRNYMTHHRLMAIGLQQSGTHALRTALKPEPNTRDVQRGYQELAFLHAVLAGSHLRLNARARQTVRQIKEGYRLTSLDLEDIMVAPCRVQHMVQRPLIGWWDRLLVELIRKVYDEQ